MRPFDWKHPDYADILSTRLANLEQLRANPAELPEIKAYYRANPADFISDWGVTFDPRNAERGLPTVVPFVLFPKQREWVDWVLARWRGQEPGLCEKSRDMGVSWLAMALSCTLCLFHDGLAIGFGSRKGEYVDKVGTFKPLLPKGRMFLENLPSEFLGDWVAWRDAPHMRISFPATGSIIAGEGGDDIGRGDRTSIYFVDEAAHLERPELIEASLSQTTNCRIDMSSVRGMANPFAVKRWGGKIKVFIFDWRDDPRKDEAWYAKQVDQLDPVVVAQEIDRDYSASVSGIVIPGAWARAAIDARERLGIALTGQRLGAFDVADEGTDKNAFVHGQGIEVTGSVEWSGVGSDIFQSTERAFELCDENDLREFRYDADGLGAGVRGDAKIINDRRKANRARVLTTIGFRGSDAVVDPDAIVEGTIGSDGDPGRANKDYFANHKAQSWWALRKRFQKTFRWVTQGIACDPDEIISISSKCPNHLKLIAELSQVTYRSNDAGKMLINKKPNGMKSPNLADGTMMLYAPMGPAPLLITGSMLRQVARARRR